MWVAYLASRLGAAALAGLLLWLLTPTARADETRLSISGYDPVAYFTDGTPVPGSSEFEYVWHDARWRFASATHRDLFAKDPEHDAPQYDGYCAMGVADAAVFGPHKDTVDPEAWAIVDGKLYLTHTRHTMDRWRPNLAENIKRADANWSAVAYQPEPTIIGPPCAMPTALREAIAGFVAAYHVERPFQKRVRDRPNLDALVRRRSNRSRQ